MNSILIAIEITEQEADVFRKMRETGVFELRDGNATLHFSKTGKLLKIEQKVFTSFPTVDVATVGDIVSL